MDVALRTYWGNAKRVTGAELSALRGALRETMCLPDDADYDTARRVWNAMIDRRPVMMVQAASAADVIQTVKFAREHGSALAVRGGGHNIAGKQFATGRSCSISHACARCTSILLRGASVLRAAHFQAMWIRRRCLSD